MDSILLRSFDDNIKSGATIDFFDAGSANTVVVCPGGAYAETSRREGAPIARAYQKAGFNAAVLNYSCAPAAVFPAALMELYAALGALKSGKLGRKTEKAALAGFSAGGHLAACGATMWRECAAPRPDAAILGYPVISYDNKGCCADTFENLVGGELTNEQARKLSLQNRVDKDCPPCYIFHTSDDAVVPSSNSIGFSDALCRNGVPFELHIFKHGVHALSLATEETVERGYEDVHVNKDVARWFEESVSFLNGIF